MTAKAEPWVGKPCAGPGCDRVLRSRSYPREQAPEAHVASGHGMCARCYMRDKDRPAAPGSVADLAVKQNAADLEAFMTARRRRGVPEHGYLSVKLQVNA